MAEAERTYFAKLLSIFRGQPGLTYHMSKIHPRMIRIQRLLSCKTNESLSLSHLEAASAPAGHPGAFRLTGQVHRK